SICDFSASSSAQVVVLADRIRSPRAIRKLVHDLSEVLVDPVLAFLSEIAHVAEQIVTKILTVLEDIRFMRLETGLHGFDDIHAGRAECLAGLNGRLHCKRGDHQSTERSGKKSSLHGGSLK
ncbi:hypothetical protein PENTCL1PPCAC_14923, partial [Pristionchus entomophagus]